MCHISSDRIGWDNRHRIGQTWLDLWMQLLHHPDRYAEALDRRDYLPVDCAIAICLGWGDKKVRDLLVFGPHKPRVGNFLERQPLPTDHDQITPARLAGRSFSLIEVMFEIFDRLGHDVDPIVGVVTP